MHTLPIGECLRFGFSTLQKRPLMLIGTFALAMAISGVASSFFDPGEEAPVTLATTSMTIAGLIVGLVVELGLLTFSIRAHDAVEKVSLNDTWNPHAFFYYAGGQILVGIAVVIGLILLIVPGIILALTFMFSSYRIVDKGMGPIEAMKASHALTKGHRWQLLLFVLALVGVNILGLLALGIGLLVTVPASMLAIVHAYRFLEEHAAHPSITA